MKKLILIIFVIGITFSGCKSPMGPEIKEIVEEKPTGQILFIGGGASVSYWQLSGQFTLREVKGVECRVEGVRLTVSFNGDPDASWSYTGGGGSIDVGTGTVPANGSLTVSFRVQLPYASQPRALVIRAWLRDIYGHEFDVYDIILLS